MKFIVEVKDSKASDFVALLSDLPHVKIKPLTSYKSKVLEDVAEAVNELNLVLKGKLSARDANELLNEL